MFVSTAGGVGLLERSLEDLDGAVVTGGVGEQSRAQSESPFIVRACIEDLREATDGLVQSFTTFHQQPGDLEIERQARTSLRSIAATEESARSLVDVAASEGEPAHASQRLHVVGVVLEDLAGELLRLRRRARRFLHHRPLHPRPPPLVLRAVLEPERKRASGGARRPRAWGSRPAGARRPAPRRGGADRRAPASRGARGRPAPRGPRCRRWPRAPASWPRAARRRRRAPRASPPP